MWNQSITSKKAEETRNVLIAFTDELWTGEILTGTATAVELWGTALTIDDVAVTTADCWLDDRKIVAGQGVQFSVSGGVARQSYTIRVGGGTTGSPIQGLSKDIRLLIT